MPQANASEIAKETLDIIPLVMQVMASAMRSTGHAVSGGHLRLLGILSARDFTLTELAEMLSVTAPTMSNTITALENRAWVTRTRSQTDRRVVLISLTPEGLAVYREIEEKTREHIRQIVSELPSEEKEMLLNGLLILRRVFEANFITSLF